MAYKLRSQDLKDATAGTTSAAIRAGGEERKEMRQIRQGLRDVRKSMKSVDFNTALDTGDQAGIDKYMGAQSRREQLTKRKADIKDWSTRKRVNVGARKDISLLDKPIQAVSKEGKPLYEAGYDSDRATVSGIKSGSKAAEAQGTGGLRYQNMFDAKGEYMYSDVATQPGSSDNRKKLSISIEKTVKEPKKKPQGKQNIFYNLGRHKALGGAFTRLGARILGHGPKSDYWKSNPQADWSEGLTDKNEKDPHIVQDNIHSNMPTGKEKYKRKLKIKFT